MITAVFASLDMAIFLTTRYVRYISFIRPNLNSLLSSPRYCHPLTPWPVTENRVSKSFYFKGFRLGSSFVKVAFKFTPSHVESTWRMKGTALDNVLFAHVSHGENAVRNHTGIILPTICPNVCETTISNLDMEQIEFVTVDPRTGRALTVVTMKVYD